MRITEARLRQIIREEAEIRLVKQTITEVVGDMQLGLTEEQQLDFGSFGSWTRLNLLPKKQQFRLQIMAAACFWQRDS